MADIVSGLIQALAHAFEDGDVKGVMLSECGEYPLTDYVSLGLVAGHGLGRPGSSRWGRAHGEYRVSRKDLYVRENCRLAGRRKRFDSIVTEPMQRRFGLSVQNHSEIGTL